MNLFLTGSFLGRNRPEQRLQRADLRRLDQVVVEAGLARRAAVLRLAPAGQRDERRRAASGAARGCGAPPRSRPCRACRCRAAPRRVVGARASRAAGAVVRRRAPRRRATSSSSAEAVGGVAVVVDDQDAPWRRARLRGRDAAAGAGRARRERQAHDELAALAGPSLFAVDACRRASRPARARARGRCRGRPGLRRRAVAAA